MPTALSNVRCWVNSGKHLLAASISPFDPTRTLFPTSMVHRRPEIGRTYSTDTPANSTTLRHFSVSSTMSLPNSDGVIVLERFGHRLIENLDNLGRRALGRGNAVKYQNRKARYGLGNCRDIRQAGPALRGCHAEPTQRSCTDLFERAGQVVEQYLHLVGN
jgi:hypothetical protein